jgi:glycosyltransferase involved in cell wall biosynthesis
VKFLLSTFNYFPNRSGGTEFYVKSLAEFLRKRGHEVTILAWVDDAEKISDVLLDNAVGIAVRYKYDQTEVIGVSWKAMTPEEIYTFETPAWTEFLRSVLTKAGLIGIDFLLMNGISSVSGLSLIRAMQSIQQIKLAVIVHTPFMCIKSDLVFAGDHRRCSEVVSPQTCGSCMISEKTGMPFGFSKMLYAMLPLSGRLLRRPLLKNYGELLHKWIADYVEIARQSNYWIVFSDDMRQFFKIQSGFPVEKLIQIRHGIDTKLFQPGRQHKSAPVRFLYAGRFEKIKGVLLLMDAWLSLPDEPAKRMLMLTGNYDVTPTGQQVYQKLKNRHDVQFVGHSTQDKLAEFYRTTDCVIIPSQYVETGPLVMHEAIASGCTVITSDIGGQSELADLYGSRAVKFKNLDSVSLRRAVHDFRRPDPIVPIPAVQSEEQHFNKLMSVVLPVA